MRKIFMTVLVSSVLILSSVFPSLAGDDGRKGELSVSGVVFHPAGEPFRPLGEFVVGYNFDKDYGASVKGVIPEHGNEDRTWGAMAGLYAVPRLGERFSLMPYVGVGVYGGNVGGNIYKAKFMTELSMRLNYDISDFIMCGFEVKYLGGKGVNMVCTGIYLGFRMR